MSSLLERMARDLLLAPSYLQRVIKSAPYRYKVYRISKRSGGSRTIAQPSADVKLCQRWVVGHILDELDVHDCAVAYRSGLSIRDNAARHRKGRYILKLDFRNFFGSIAEGHVESFLREAYPEMARGDTKLVTRLLCWRPSRASGLVVSVGAPSSPHLSNVIMCEFDATVSLMCSQRGVTYTRYADDLTFSSQRSGVLATVQHEVERVAAEYRHAGLRINPDKTVHTSKRHRRRVTGMVITNEGDVSLGRRRKRELRAAVHAFKIGKAGENEAAQWLQGWLMFARSVEPSFYERLVEKYGEEVFRKLRAEAHKA